MLERAAVALGESPTCICQATGLLSMADQTIGQWMDERTDFQQKAAYLAEKTAEAFLRSHLDATAKEHLDDFCRRQSCQLFYREFFRRYASVFGPRDAPMVFTCRNASACTISLIREIDQCVWF